MKLKESVGFLVNSSRACSKKAARCSMEKRFLCLFLSALAVHAYSLNASVSLSNVGCDKRLILTMVTAAKDSKNLGSDEICAIMSCSSGPIVLCDPAVAMITRGRIVMGKVEADPTVVQHLSLDITPGIPPQSSAKIHRTSVKSRTSLL